MAPRLALIFPPALRPTSPPLGLASLQAYAKQVHPDWEVKVFDLNLAHYNQGLAWMAAGRLRIALKGWDHETTASKTAQAQALLSGEQGLHRFLDLAAYDRAANTYRRWERVMGALFEDFARKQAAGLKLPPLGDQYLEELIQPVLDFKPDLAGFSLLFSQQLYFSLALARRVKRAGAVTVLGGATLSVMPDPGGLIGGAIVSRIGGLVHHVETGPMLDYLLAGEGEKGLAALMADFGGDPSLTPGLIYRGDGDVKHNPPQMVSPREPLPLPDFSGLEPGGYHSPLPVIPYLTSRGCYWGRCTFCTHQKPYLAYREEPVERSVEHLARLQKQHGARHFVLVDEMIHPHRFGALSRSMAAAGLNIHFSAYAKPTGGFTPELLRQMHQSGCRCLWWGVESGSQRVLNLMDKGVKAKAMEMVLGDSHEAGIWNMIFLLFGFPTETADEWDRTMDMVRRLGPAIDAMSKSRFVLMNGSGVHNDPQAFGLTEVRDRPERDPVSVAFDYSVKSGLTQEQTTQRYRDQAPELKGYGRSPNFGFFRDHMLIHAAQ